MKRGLAVAVMAGASLVAYERLVKPWQQRWGATDEELTMPLPGDERVAEPATQVTRAITIDAAAQGVWPWILQLGADRGGFYSYEGRLGPAGDRPAGGRRARRPADKPAVGAYRCKAS